MLHSGNRAVASVLAAVCLIALSGLVSRVSAQSIQLLVELNGGPTIPITDNSAFDTDPAVGTINVNTTLLNAALPQFQFTSLSATTNSPGTAQASLSQNGSVQLTPGTTTGLIWVYAYGFDYTVPSGNANILISSASSTFLNTLAGDDADFQSWVVPNNSPDSDIQGGEGPPMLSTGPFPNSQSETTSPHPINYLTPFALRDSTTISMHQGPLGTPSQVQFAGTSIFLSNVPEPASFGILLGSLGVLSILARRRPHW